jgi:GTP pyrophosphokinase
MDEVLRVFGYKNPDDLFIAIGSGGVSLSQLASKLSTELKPPSEVVEITPTRRISPVSIKVLGVGDLLTRLASCCHPLPGDGIIGYITQGRGITVHRRDCPNILNEVEKERLIDVAWGDVEQVYPVDIQVDAWDRVGLIRDISAIIAGEGVNIDGINMINHGNNTVSLFFTLEIRSVVQLTRLISKIYSVWNVINIVRKGEISV